ncbi:carbon-nitrogen hydrolase family protein [Colwellia sp. MB02u-18]|nr:carbon-nitrogen hydrolase family protein [Colwellia sp. MB3u-45]MBA6268471.1 carbon-nitrogen hydrolase family protein [Colwellia sp. MB3u-43]MBA6319922.1 carbon-nitrogen hydrolase family protein [Colwellia sp. MB02u-19]MBA6324534.1 carbon-nitrogen hydrolase family protein [Colwellia sp. MB02u-18]MBA6330689.1 carbon-nitrogen hydrolase family protein [Colwellia sp. MB02u-12]MBA6346205.1 carbon-nitrogen hydrolase family protein [Colwellia sp. MB02u-1]
MQICAIQMSSNTRVEDNIADIEQQLATLELAQQQLVLLPECCLFFGGKDKAQLALAKENQQSNGLKTRLGKLAIKYNVFLVAGSIPVLSNQPEKFTNSCFVFSPEGQELGSYDKIHLFDVAVQDNEKNYCESRYVKAGDHTSVVNVAGVKVGLSICYDLRFPALFHQLCQQGAKIITVPSAFTRVTGAAHWQTLLQARAIENQVYIVAAGQEGVHLNGRETWGHSMIISPWGEILTQLDISKGIICADYQEQELDKVRKAMPVATHNRFKNKLMSYE